MRWWSSKHAQTVTFNLVLILLELLPLETALLLATALDGGDVPRVAIPLWCGLLIMGAGTLTGGMRARLGRRRSSFVGVAALVAGCVLLVCISPAAFGSDPSALLSVSTAQQTLSRDAGLWVRLALLLVATLYLWYRGLLLGSQSPSAGSVQRRLNVGLAVMIGAAFLLPSVFAGVRAAYVGLVTLMLPLEVFCGLVGSALAQRAARSGSADASASPPRPWVALAVFFSWVVVAAALVLGLVVNGDPLHAALRAFGPVGAVVDGAILWLANGIAHVLGGLFGGNLHPLTAPTVRRTVVSPQVCTRPECKAVSHPPAWLAQLVGIAGPIVWVLLLAIATFVGYRVLRRVSRRGQTFDSFVDEERESLDGRSVIRQQLRDLLGRRGGAAVAAEETLDRDGVRHLYREALRAAAHHGHARREAETPDEFAERLAREFVADVSGSEASSLRVLTAAYDDARYGATERDERASTNVRTQARRLIATLSRT